MTDYMQEIATILKVAEVPGVEILQSDEAIFEALKAHIASLQDIAAKSDTWRLSAENWRKDFGEADNALSEIRRALIDSSEVATDMQDTAAPAAIASSVKRSLEYLAAARDSARMYSGQMANLEKSTERTIADRTAALERERSSLNGKVAYWMAAAESFEAECRGLERALRIVLDTRGR